ncbi:hypothetical protein, partial [Pseudofrankia sp. BMG5.37]
MNALGPWAARWGPPVAFALFTLVGVAWQGVGWRGADAARLVAAGIAVVAVLLVRPGHRLRAPAAA